MCSVVFVNGRVNDEGVKDYKDCSGNQCSVFIRVDVTFDASRVSCTKVDSCPLTCAHPLSVVQTPNNVNGTHFTTVGMSSGWPGVEPGPSSRGFSLYGPFAAAL